MTDVDFHALVGRALPSLIDGLAPFVERVLSSSLPDGTSWTALLERKDNLAGRHGLKYSPRDLSLLLRALTEPLGNLGYPFDRELSRQARGYASELREARNLWAHNEPFTPATAYRAIDSAELLLRLVEATEQADQLALLKLETLPAIAEPTFTSETAPNEQAELAPQPEAVLLPEPASPASVAAPSAITLTIATVPFLSYAMAHCHIAIVDEVVIENAGPETRGASLEVEVSSVDGTLSTPKFLISDLGANQTTTLRDIELMLDPARMLAVEEQRPGVIRATLRDAQGTVIAAQAVEVQVLAFNQWVANPVSLGLELLAAHVQPNSAAIVSLLTEASDLLEARTGSSSLNGYQSGNEERVDAIVEAIYDAMRARDIRYAVPPASWGANGQKVRTPAEVLEGRLGTCLDTTVTLAAALEQAGINSTLWLLEGHIFLGYWRVESSLGTVAISDVADILNLVDLGYIALVETTAIAGGDASLTFAEARRLPHTQHLSEGTAHFFGITDIKEARESRIFPLPSRSISADGETIVTVYQGGAGATIEPYYALPGAAEPTTCAAVPSRVAQWKNALLDLSLRNKLINYTDRSGYSLAVPGPAIARMEDAVNAGAPISLLPSDDVPSVDKARGIRFGRDLPENTRELLLADKKSAFIDITGAAYTSKLRYLANKAKTIVEETGANNLYLAFGMLHWRFNDRDLRSPLVLVPVTMSTTSRGSIYRITIDESGSSTPNYCLLEKLRQSFGLEIPGLSEPSEDASGIDLPAAFASVREALLKASLPFRVEETVDLSVLQFAKFRLWKDLDDNWQTLANNSLVSHLINSPLEPFADPVTEAPPVDLDELAAVVPVPADSSQLEAVAEAVGGRTFVLEGPPGTGKSQTITNLLARSLAAGKRVLFVAEKRAALDVVKKRLESVGLGEFSLDLHDKSARPAAVRAQIKAALDFRIQPDAAALQAHGEAADSSRRTLSRYADRLHERNAAGLSLYSAHDQELASDSTVTPLDVPSSFVANSTPETFSTIRSTLRLLPGVSDLARPREFHPWGFVDDREGDRLDLAVIIAAARTYDAALSAAQQAGFGIDALSRVDAADQLGRWQEVAGAPRHPLAVIDAMSNADWQSFVATALKEIAAIQSTTPTWATSVKPQVLVGDVPAIHAAALAADESGFFGRKKKRRAVLALFANDLVVDPATIPLKTLSGLTGALLASHTEAGRVRAGVLKLPIPLVDANWNPFDSQQAERASRALKWLSWLGRTLGTTPSEAPAGTPVIDMRGYYEASVAGSGQAQLAGLEQAWSGLKAVLRSTPQQRAAWAGDQGFSAAWWHTRSARNLDGAQPVTLERWLDLVHHLEPLRQAGLDSARTAFLEGVIPADDAALAFDRGVALASIVERREATALVDFDIAAHNRTIQRFSASTAAVRSELPRAIPADVLGLRRFNSSQDSGQIGGLRRQLERQRGGMSVRALLQNYGELITQVMPCTLMSPESVARFFPAHTGLFDIVVFDEASQIRVADAIGAMGRATAVVIVGDSKQMPPTSFAEASSGIDDENTANAEVVADEESILTECVQARVPSKWLSWHYRSQDESLITFSNHRYYESRLSSFPAPRDTGSSEARDGHGVSLVRVAGQFQRTGKGKMLRTNETEALAIVAEVQRRFDASPTDFPSVGIITFNAPQRDLIENMLRDNPDDRITLALDDPDGLFVKNLENVQGDERDSILFSIAFSANESGVVPLNFGPLSRAGGERRLNVAITRARRQVVLYSSFDPALLRAQETTSVGIKHLKAYLEMADRGVSEENAAGHRSVIADRHRDDIAAELRLRGFAVRTDLGLSDFRIDISIADAAEPTRPLVAVLLDGPNWRERRTVSDRDGLPVEVLQGLMRWPGVERVWLPEWLQDREATLDRITESVAAAAAVVVAGSAASSAAAGSASTSDSGAEAPAGPARPLRTAPAETITAQPLAVPETYASHDEALRSFAGASISTPVLAAMPSRSSQTEFVPWSPTKIGSIDVLDTLPRQAPTAKVRDTIQAVIDAEGPIHIARLAKLVAGSFGLDRVVQARASAILRCMPSDVVRGAETQFVWPSTIDPSIWKGARRVSLSEQLPLEHVSLVEIANAMRLVTEAAAGMDEQELKRESLATFGGKRITEAIGTRLDQALAFGFESGRLARAANGLIISSP